jgi:hypothetical protein
MDKKKAMENDTEERREGDKVAKMIMDIKKLIIFPTKFNGTCADLKYCIVTLDA